MEAQRAPAKVSEAELRQGRQVLEAILAETGKAVVGLDRVMELLVVALLAEGHVLMEGVPGVAKTTVAKAFAGALGLAFRRIQFTPDLLPSDITGSYIYNMKTSAFDLRRGPIFAHVVLADEINRAPAKTQAALLECMQERQVTIEGETLPLDPPFVVVATQNPIEQEGVYPLPEAQVDRFLMKVTVGYPTAEAEKQMVRHYRSRPQAVGSVIPAGWIVAAQDTVQRIHMEDSLVDYVVDLARATREHAAIALGVSPRACLALQGAARANALLSGRDYVIPDDVQEVAPEVLRHRLILKPEAELEGLDAGKVLAEVLSAVPLPTAFQPATEGQRD